jgi:hypothetical protein
VTDQAPAPKALAFLRDLHDLCRRHKATIVGCVFHEDPKGSCGSVDGFELVSLAASKDDAVATLHAGKAHVHLSAEKGNVTS